VLLERGQRLDLVVAQRDHDDPPVKNSWDRSFVSVRLRWLVRFGCERR
jgi:hypothetical protein